MMNVAAGLGVLSIAIALLVIFHARKGVTHPAMFTNIGKGLPLATVALVVLGTALIVNGLIGIWL